jgi:hypothetical protein
MTAENRLKSRSHAVFRVPWLGLATVAALVGGALLVAAEFVDLYHVVGANGELVAGAKATQTGGDHHGYAFVLIGSVVIVATLVARWTEQPLPAIGVAALGLITLAVVLIGDLPDVTSSGITKVPEIGDAQPAVGFWLELAGALVTLVSGLAIARLLTLGRRDRTEGRRKSEL